MRDAAGTTGGALNKRLPGPRQNITVGHGDDGSGADYGIDVKNAGEGALAYNLTVTLAIVDPLNCSRSNATAQLIIR